MIEEIKKEITKLEISNSIKVLYAVESGSRAWGFASTDSDWDVRFIYIHPMEWYLSIDEKKDNFEKILPNDIDLGGWELRKALKLFRKSNPPLLEWLRSPIIYREVEPFTTSLRDLSKDYFSSKNCTHHYLHMAEGNYRDYLQGETVRVKKYFYVLRPLLACKWIEVYDEMPPMEFEVMLEKLITDETLMSIILNLLHRKKSGQELSLEKRIEPLNKFCEEMIAYYQEFVRSFDNNKYHDMKTLNELFRKTLKESW